jgi:uncharacterized protein (TIGR02594 family)
MTIVKYAKESDFPWVNDDETPWCSIFVNWVGMKRSKKANARSWLRVGESTINNPQPGHIVVFWRDKPESWKGHVGIFLGYSSDKKRVFCLGGNQGNQVSVSAYFTDTVLGIRNLGNEKALEIPDPELKKGSNEIRKVKQLQEILNSKGFDCGIVDGIFGPATEKAVKELQTNKYGLPITGIYNDATRNFLIELMQE